MTQVFLSRSALVVGALAALALPAPAQQPFEGVITVRMSSEAGTQSSTFSVKGEKLRMDLSAGGGDVAIVMDRAAQKTYILMPSRQMYMEQNTPELAAPPAAQQQGPEAQVTWTGRKETIAGYECEHATVKGDDGSEFDACVAKGLAFFAQPQGPGARRGGGASWQRHIAGGFPLKVQKAGDAKAVFEVTKIEPRKLNDDLFTPSPGWQRMTMPGGRP